jgi:AraC family transcriptional regulator of adaptative response/methylated-DNA-[protein]-cysteine methyltransferase
MTTETPIDIDAAWAAFEARDRAHDGRFVVAVKTTGIYCKPSCPARHPRRENVDFYRDAAGARNAGFRACLRCKPDEVGRDRVAVANAIALLEAAEDSIPLEELAAEVGYAPHHFHRLFKRATGVTPAAYLRGLRATRVAQALKEASVTSAIYEAGYSAPSRFYEGGAKRLGMTPSAWRQGGAGVTIRWTIADTSLGKLLIAATDKGLCRVSFDSPDRDQNLPIDVRGTAFQEAVWQALRDIPAGETRSYAELAAAAGNPKAVRAVGSACGANHVAVVIPCHRVQRSDGSIGGYAYGADRKAALLNREGAK